jgi:hypothetical protein
MLTSPEFRSPTNSNGIAVPAHQLRDKPREAARVQSSLLVRRTGRRIASTMSLESISAGTIKYCLISNTYDNSQLSRPHSPQVIQRWHDNLRHPVEARHRLQRDPSVAGLCWAEKTTTPATPRKAEI